MKHVPTIHYVSCFLKGNNCLRRIGATAVGVQFFVGIFGMMARLGEHLVGRVWK